ncbi:LOW QUALITY PROTEIN: TBC1 domain family member 10B-like [Liolophura sinensis]|uniref:LOW QUALITY PROTEIN: TBC1 domain family member 10B-like n=1 Tax=Liolophura sinensis TaxID=3198878 RepID=UPI0031587053
MANSSRNSLDSALNNHDVTDDQIHSDSEDDDEEQREDAGNKSPSANGQPVRSTDRYGFLGGQQYTDPEQEFRIPVEVTRKREMKWLEMFENWEKWMSKRFKKVKDRCRKGIPPSIRPRAWQYLCGSQFLLEHNKGKYEELIKQEGEPKWVDDITKDLHRQFPLHEMFAARGGHGQGDMFNVLKAYTIYNPQDGYCQAQGPIAAVLLMHMPAEQAFWCLVSICEKYLPGYYSPGLEAVQTDGEVLNGLLKKTSTPVYKHLKKQKIDPILYMMEWFMCVFARTLPWSCVLRVWDMFFCEGVKVVFRVALVLVKFSLEGRDKLSQCPTIYETMEKLRHFPPEMLHEEVIIKESLRLPITERDMEKEHRVQLDKRRAREKEKAGNADALSKRKRKEDKR